MSEKPAVLLISTQKTWCYFNLTLNRKCLLTKYYRIVHYYKNRINDFPPHAHIRTKMRTKSDFASVWTMVKITIRKCTSKPLPDEDNECLKPLTWCLGQNILERNWNDSETMHFWFRVGKAKICLMSEQFSNYFVNKQQKM